MPEVATLRIGAILFEGFELLDLYGPLEMFGMLGIVQGGVAITSISTATGPVKSGAGPRGMAEAVLQDCGGFDLLLIPGGMGTRTLVDDVAFINDLKRISEASKIVATVCTGSMLLAATGLLDGHRATTNKRVFNMIRTRFPKVRWAPRARWVEEGKYVTSSGVSAGTDMALGLISKLRGRETAVQVAARTEYVWNEDAGLDPFAVEL